MTIENCCIARHVFAEDVKLEVDDGADLDVFEVGILLGVGDDADGDVAFAALYIRFAGGEADAVDGDGAFVHAEISAGDHLFGGVVFKAVVPASIGFVGVNTNGFLIDVSLDDMSVETSSHEHGTLDVDIIADLEEIEIGETQGFLHRGDGIEVTFDLYDREADAVMGDRLIDSQRFAKGVAKREMFIRLLGLNLHDLSHSFYNS